MANASITFRKAEALRWVQSMKNIDGNIGSIVFDWDNTHVTFQRAQLDELLGVLHILTSTDDEMVFTRNEGNLVQVITDSDGHTEYVPLGANA